MQLLLEHGTLDASEMLRDSKLALLDAQHSFVVEDMLPKLALLEKRISVLDLPLNGALACVQRASQLHYQSFFFNVIPRS